MFDYLSSVCAEGGMIWGVGKQPDDAVLYGYLQRDKDEFYASFEGRDLEKILRDMLETAGKRKYN